MIKYFKNTLVFTLIASFMLPGVAMSTETGVASVLSSNLSVGDIIRKCNDGKADGDHYCPSHLSNQVEKAYSSGLWGFITRGITGDGEWNTPIKTCRSEFAPTSFLNQTPQDLEVYLARSEKSTLNYSISEIYPHCLNQYDEDPQGSEKKKLMITQFYLANNILEKDSQDLIKAIGGTNGVLGKPVADGIDCIKIKSEKVKQTCLKTSQCSQISTGESERVLSRLADDTLKVYQEIEALKNKISTLRFQNIGMTRDLREQGRETDAQIEKIEAVIDMKMNDFPWLKGDTFQSKAQKLNRDKVLNKKAMKSVIKSQLNATKKKLIAKLEQTGNSQKCINGTEEGEICDDLNKRIINSNNFSGVSKLFKQNLKNYSEDSLKAQKNAIKEGLNADLNYHIAQCTMSINEAKDETGELVADVAIGIGLTVATMGVGGIVAATAIGTRAALLAKTGLVVSLAADGGFAVQQGNKAHNICTEEFKTLKAFKASSNKNLCPVSSDMQNFSLERDLSHCVAEYTTSLVLSALPVISGGVVLKTLKEGSRGAKSVKPLGSVVDDLSNDVAAVFTKKEVGVYHRQMDLENMVEGANGLSGQAKVDKLKEIERIGLEISETKKKLGSEMFTSDRYLAYKKHHIDSKKPLVEQVEEVLMSEDELQLLINRNKERSADLVVQDKGLTVGAGNITDTRKAQVETQMDRVDRANREMTEKIRARQASQIDEPPEISIEEFNKVIADQNAAKLEREAAAKILAKEKEEAKIAYDKKMQDMLNRDNSSLDDIDYADMTMATEKDWDDAVEAMRKGKAEKEALKAQKLENNKVAGNQDRKTATVDKDRKDLSEDEQELWNEWDRLIAKKKQKESIAPKVKNAQRQQKIAQADIKILNNKYGAYTHSKYDKSNRRLRVATDRERVAKLKTLKATKEQDTTQFKRAFDEYEEARLVREQALEEVDHYKEAYSVWRKDYLGRQFDYCLRGRGKTRELCMKEVYESSTAPKSSL